MSGGELREFLVAQMSRRAFISVVRTGMAGTSLITLASACGDGDGGIVTRPGLVTGLLRGTVADMSGRAQPIGRIYLLQKSGLNADVYADVDGQGRFDFGAVEVGEYQLRYWGANLAQVPEALPNPLRITIDAATPTVVRFQIVLGDESSAPERDIYAGDFFFQEQPTGVPNGTVVVKLGTIVCWYNVGTVPHTVTGGPWNDSGPIGLTGSFDWLASEVGTFLYSCAYHQTRMVGTLQVVS